MNYWTGEVLEGGKIHKVAAPLEQIPLLARQGAVIPMRAYARSIEKGTNDTITLHIYPGANSEFTLIEDDGPSNDYLKGIYAKTKIVSKVGKDSQKIEIAPILGYYAGMQPERTWQVCVHATKGVNSIVCNSVGLEFTNQDNQVISAYYKIDKSKKTIFEIKY